mmetsp:Transcript_4184/g.6127  ORF Transcript_4184/g.6127 Transcript_4184/m.6127 type:complete len:275 (-) Transcript_4184:349-1173(-)
MQPSTMPSIIISYNVYGLLHVHSVDDSDGTMEDKVRLQGPCVIAFVPGQGKLDENLEKLVLDLVQEGRPKGSIQVERLGNGEQRFAMYMIEVESWRYGTVDTFGSLYGGSLEERSEFDSTVCLEQAGKAKDLGTQAFKAKRYVAALRSYRCALNELFKVRVADRVEKETLKKELLIPLLLNCAQCSINLEEYPNALSYCDRVISIDSCNQKALYRRCLALIHTGDYSGAEECVQLVEQAPNQTSAPYLRKTLSRMLTSTITQEKAVAQAMFTKK